MPLIHFDSDSRLIEINTKFNEIHALLHSYREELSGNRARLCSIAITETEKAIAFFYTYVAGEEYRISHSDYCFVRPDNLSLRKENL